MVKPHANDKIPSTLQSNLSHVSRPTEIFCWGNAFSIPNRKFPNDSQRAFPKHPFHLALWLFVVVVGERELPRNYICFGKALEMKSFKVPLVLNVYEFI